MHDDPNPRCIVCYARVDIPGPCDECVSLGYAPDSLRMEAAGYDAEDHYCPAHGSPLVMGMPFVIWECSCSPEPRKGLSQ